MLDVLILLDIIRQMEEVHVGHYILGRTIGYGSFAKVKCTGC